MANAKRVELRLTVPYYFLSLNINTEDAAKIGRMAAGPYGNMKLQWEDQGYVPNDQGGQDFMYTLHITIFTGQSLAGLSPFIARLIRASTAPHKLYMTDEDNGDVLYDYEGSSEPVWQYMLEELEKDRTVDLGNITFTRIDSE